MRQRSEHADALVRCLVAVADRAEADRAMRDAVAQAFRLRLRVDQPRREQHGAGANLAFIKSCGKAAILAPQLAHAAAYEVGAVALRLLAQAREQRAAVDALEARIIVALGDQRRAALAGVDQFDIASVA